MKRKYIKFLGIISLITVCAIKLNPIAAFSRWETTLENGTPIIVYDQSEGAIFYSDSYDANAAKYGKAYTSQFASKEAYMASHGYPGWSASNPNPAYAGQPATNTAPAAPAATPKAPAKPKCTHEYATTVTKAPTCAEKGERKYTCSKCGDTYTKPIDIDETAHNMESKVTKEPTCGVEGETTKTCTICGYEEKEPIPALTHNYTSSVTKEPTCTEPGVTTFKCEICGDEYTEEIETLGHNEGEWEVTVEKTTFKNGEKVKKCTICGEVLKTEIITSDYPITVLYAIYGVCGALAVALIVFIVLRAIKSHNNNKE